LGERSRFVDAWVRLFICLMFLPGVVAFSGPAGAGAGGPFPDGSLVPEANTEAHELVRLAYSEAQMAQERPTGGLSQAGTGQTETQGAVEDADPWAEEDAAMEDIPDPLESMNRAFFVFNDKVYFWFFKPIGTGYKKVVPEVGRICIRNFFTNLIMPIRAVSCLLQGKFEGVGIELVRCMVNTTAGFLGFQDVAKDALDYPVQDEDLGQVMAFYGIGSGCYLNLPFLGPSNIRDTVGWVGGLYLNPLDYMVTDFWPNVGFRSFDMLNKTSMRIGEYEALKKAAVDPYVAMRDAYYQYRLNQIEK
jgi:phospholipid-binding lipoprotein MlaA